MSIHVLQLGPYPPPEGGVSRNMLAIRDELIKRGDRCSIIAISRSKTERDEPDVFHPRGPKEILRLLSSIKFDILHLHVGGDLDGRILGLALIASFFAGKKSVLTVHSGAFPLTAEAKSAKPFSKHGIIFRRFGGIIAVNDALASVFHRFGVADERIHKILPFALRLPDESVVVPQELADFSSDHSPLLLSVGGLEKDYDPLFQVEAMGEILREFPKAGLLIVGDGSMRNEVQSAVNASGYHENILVVGNVEHAVTLHLIDRADILLRMTLFDGDAISIREALFLGTPVIATDNHMRPDGTHLITIGDRSGLVRGIKDLADSKQKRPEKRAADDHNINQVIELYKALL